MATEEKKVFDIENPDKVKPPETSRPVIVGHKNMVQDPTIVQQPSEAAPETPAAAPPAMAGTGKIIQPLDSAKEPEAQPEKTATKPPEEKKPMSEKPEQKPAGEGPVEAPKDASPNPGDKDDSYTDVGTETKPAPPPVSNAETIAPKEYALPIKKRRKTNGKQTAVFIGIILLVALIFTVIMADAGFFELPVGLPFDLIKNADITVTPLGGTE